MKTTGGKDTTKYGQLTLWTSDNKLRLKGYGLEIVRKKRSSEKPPREKKR